MDKVRIPQSALNAIIDWPKYQKVAAGKLKETFENLFPIDARTLLKQSLDNHSLLKETTHSYFGLLIGLGPRLYYLPHMSFSNHVSGNDFIRIKDFKTTILSIFEQVDELTVIINPKAVSMELLRNGDQQKLPFFTKNTHWEHSRRDAKIISSAWIDHIKLLNPFLAKLSQSHHLHSIMVVGDDLHIHILQNDFHSSIVKTSAPDFPLDQQIIAYPPPLLEDHQSDIKSLEKLIWQTDTIQTSHGFLSSINVKYITLNDHIITGTELERRQESYADLFLISELPLRFLVSLPSQGEVRLFTVDHLTLEVIDFTSLNIPLNRTSISTIQPIHSISNHTWLMDHLL